MKNNLILGDIAAAKEKDGGELARTLMAIGAKLLDATMRDGGMDEAEALKYVTESLGMAGEAQKAARGGKAAKRGAERADDAHEKAVEAAAALNELAEAGTLEGEIDDYLADEAFLALLEEFPAKAALRIYAAEKRGKEGEARGERSIVEKLRMNAALPESGKGGKAAEPRVNFMKLSKREFDGFKKELARRAGR